MGRTGSPGKHLKGWVEGAGFTKVQHKMFKVPMGPWPEDPTLVRPPLFRSNSAQGVGR